MNKRILMLIGIILYYVEINSVKHEVYCINQDLGTPDDNPQTGDNIVLYLIGLSISIIGFVSGKQYLKHNN